jgi:hypothetical protein
MDNHDIAQKVVSYFKKKTKTPLSEDTLNILLTVSHLELEKIITSQYLYEEKNEYRFLCYVYQQWREQFLQVSRIHKNNASPKSVAIGVKSTMSGKDIEEGLKLFQEIDALNVFESVTPPLFLNI